MDRLSDSKVRGLIGLALLVLLCVGLIIFCLLYLADTEDSTFSTGLNEKEKTSKHYQKNTSEDEEDESTATEKVTATPGTFETESKYKIRLNKKDNSSSGIVYIETDEREGFVCIDGYDVNAATVTCRELGFKHGIPYNNRVEYYPYTRYTHDEPILSLLNCTGSEQRLSECAGFRLDNETTCTWFTGVVCYDEDEPYELRLTNGSHPDSGMVEMKLGGKWGIFCGIRRFDDEVADILCRNMNYTGGLTTMTGEQGSVPADTKVWVPFLYCGSGIEIKQTIFECTLTLHTENILVDNVEFRNNRYKNEYMACLGDNSHAAAVHCLK